MRKKQISVVLIGMVVIIVMTVYPPWYASEQLIYESAKECAKRFGDDPNELSLSFFPLYTKSIKYSFTWKRPWDVVWDEPHERTGATSSQYRINFVLLFMQWAIVAVITGGLISHLKLREERKQ